MPVIDRSLSDCRYPAGASPFGVQDLIRSVWQYTSEFQDIHTRSVIVRGGSNYHPYRGQECRWIENDDGTPRNFSPPGGPHSDHGTPACFNSSAANFYDFQKVNNNVPGSFDPKTGKNLSHPMGGSHWYFPPAYALNSYNKYCELQYKCQLFSNFSIENAERMENFP